MTSAAAVSRENPRNAVRDARDRRRAPRRRQHLAEIDHAAAAGRALRRRLAGALGAADAGADFSRRARERRRAMDDGHLRRRAAAGALRSALDSGAGHERRAAAGDAVRQQHRARAVRARGDACRRAGGGDLAGLFADVEGFRQAQEHDRAARSRRDLCLQPKAIRAGAGGDQAAAYAPRSSAAMPTAAMRFRFATIAATPETRCGRKGLRGRRAGYDRKIPVHLGLDRHAEGRDQHPAHADLEPAGQGADLVVSRTRARRSGHSRLAAVEPHLWRQPQFQPGAAQRRHALYRRRQAGAGPVRDLARQSAQRDADGVFQRAARLRHADRGAARATTSCAAGSSAR